MLEVSAPEELSLIYILADLLKMALKQAANAPVSPQEMDEKRAAMTRISPEIGKKRGREFTTRTKDALVGMMINAQKTGGLSYPSEGEKLAVVREYNVSLMQVNNFASNYRRRVEVRQQNRRG